MSIKSFLMNLDFSRIFSKTYTVTFYMKSGNKIVADKVKEDFTIQYRGNSIVGVSDFRQIRPKVRLKLVSLNLSQIEAITYE